MAHSNHINKLCGDRWRLQNITHIDLHGSGIAHVCDEFFQDVALHGRLKYLNLANNAIAKPNRLIVDVKSLEEVYMSGNPIECTCDSMWFASWLMNFTAPSGVRIVKDYEKVTCYGGQWSGTAVHKLDAVEMGCFPAKLAT